MIYIFDTSMTIQDKIRIIRNSKGFTQEYVAEKLNIDTVNYGRIERGQANLTIERLLKLAEIMDFKPSFLFDEKSEYFQDNNFDKIYKVELQILDELKKINNKIY